MATATMWRKVIFFFVRLFIVKVIIKPNKRCNLYDNINNVLHNFIAFHPLCGYLKMGLYFRFLSSYCISISPSMDCFVLKHFLFTSEELIIM